MGWPYEFAALSHEEKLLRRLVLDRYARTAHYSALLALVLFCCLARLLPCLLLRRPHRGGRVHGHYEAVPGSPGAKADGHSALGGLASRRRTLAWWLGEDVVMAGRSWGQRDQWLLGAAWAAWLLFLSTAGTGRDYFHLSKRFGAVAVSQLPIQYLLSLKSISPLSYALGTSHEHVNRYHRTLGRIIYALLLVHILLYNAYFFMAGVWAQRVFEPVVLFGVVASVGMHAINATAARAIRDWSYRVFFVVHVATAVALPPLIWFHAPPLRLYLAEALALFVADLAVRKTGTVVAPATIDAVPGTNLVRVTASMPVKKLAEYGRHPGSHVYLSIPRSARTTAASRALIFDFLYNPFTVADVDEEGGMMRLVARHRGGPATRFLAQVASQAQAPDRPPLVDAISLGIEGPYGAAGKHLGDLVALASQGRVLLVAGGIGATFTLPLYRALARDGPAGEGTRVRFVWAVRHARDASWAAETSVAETSLLHDPGVRIFVTGDRSAAAHIGADEEEGVEMLRLGQGEKRPDWEAIVDEVFRLGLEEPVAVLVCGPKRLTRDVRRRVRPWAARGRRIWWHDEHFEW